MGPRARIRFSGIAAAFLLVSTGCSNRPTYPKGRLAESLQEILESDQLHASVRLVDHTLGVQLAHAGALAQTGGQIGLGSEFQNIIRAVITALHRVVLSTDTDVTFYVILLSDPQVPGAYLTMVRYLEDVRQAEVNILPPPEIFARTVFEMSFAGTTPLTIDQYVPRGITLEEFLSWQLARRIQTTLSEKLQPPGVASVGRCSGTFQDGEFAFTLDVASTKAAPLDDATMQQMFEVSTGVIAKVLSSYRFESFNSVRLIHPLTGRNLVLPKTRLSVFR